MNKDVLERAKKVKLLLLDVDGVLTNGEIVFDETGREIKFFHVTDGMGIKLLQKAGIKVGIISSRYSKVTAIRAKELGIDIVFQGKFEKLEVFERVIKKLGLSKEEVAYIGDDWVDIPILKRVGLAVTVPNSQEPVKEFAHFVTSKEGGKGAVREVCDLILKSQGKWQELLNYYLD